MDPSGAALFGCFRGLSSIFRVLLVRNGSSMLAPSWLRGKGFAGAQCLDVTGSLQLLNSSHLRESDKMLLRSILCGVVWNGFLLEKGQEG